MRCIERIVKRVPLPPSAVDGEILKVQHILSSLEAPGPYPDENETAESVSPLPSNQSRGDTGAAQFTDNGTFALVPTPRRILRTTNPLSTKLLFRMKTLEPINVPVNRPSSQKSSLP